MAQLVLDRRRSRSSWPRLLVHLDYVLIACTLAISAFGVLIVYTATRDQLVHQGLNPHHWLDRQALWVVIGLVVMAVVAAIDYRKFELAGYLFYGVIILALAGIFVIGHSAHGAARWYQLGPIRFQPSQFAALALIMAVAAYAQRHEEPGFTLKRVVAALVMAAVPAVLIIKQPDLGSTIVMVVAFGAVLVVSGVKLRYLVALGVLGVVGIVAIVSLGLLSHYQAGRITAFLNPHASVATNSAAYTLHQSKIAIGNGSLTGEGLFKGPQTNLGYVPFQYTDFIFTAVAEQLGFIGSASLLAVFAVMIWRLLRLAQMARDQYGRLLCAGVLGLIGFSVFQNVGMTMGIMPITGIPLPFVSYGGSATVAFFAGIGLALNVGMRRRA